MSYCIVIANIANYYHCRNVLQVYVHVHVHVLPSCTVFCSSSLSLFSPSFPSLWLLFPPSLPHSPRYDITLAAPVCQVVKPDSRSVFHTPLPQEGATGDLAAGVVASKHQFGVRQRSEFVWPGFTFGFGLRGGGGKSLVGRFEGASVNLLYL